MKFRARRALREALGPRLSPTFLIIGAQKSGTTSLFHYLTAHPAIGGSQPKEVHYFDRHFAVGPRRYRANFPHAAFRLKTKLLRGVEAQIGEASPYYIFHPHAPVRAAAFDPELRLIAVLRDPVDRAYSHYQHERRRGHEQLSFGEAIEREPDRIDAELERTLADPTYWSGPLRRFSYLARGRYLEQLERWLACFSRDRLLVLSSDDLRDDPAATVDACFRFLCVPEWRAPSHPRFHAFSYEPMSPATRARLARYFAEPNRQLYAFFGRDLGWTRPAAAGEEASESTDAF